MKGKEQGVPLEGSEVWVVLAMELPYRETLGVLDLYVEQKVIWPEDQSINGLYCFSQL